MSSKVLTGEAARPAEPIAWKKIAAPGREPFAGIAGPGGDLFGTASEAQLAQLRQEAERREQQAFAAGYCKGEAAAQQQAAALLNPVIERFTHTIEELAAGRRRLRREAERDVVLLAIAIARRIIHRELSLEPEAILGVVKAALDKLEGREIDRVRLHPDDAVLVRRFLEQQGTRQLEVAPDARLERGSAIFETPRGNLDASLQTQLEEIQRGLVDRLRA